MLLSFLLALVTVRAHSQVNVMTTLVAADSVIMLEHDGDIGHVIKSKRVTGSDLNLLGTLLQGNFHGHPKCSRWHHAIFIWKKGKYKMVNFSFECYAFTTWDLAITDLDFSGLRAFFVKNGFNPKLPD